MFQYPQRKHFNWNFSEIVNLSEICKKKRETIKGFLNVMSIQHGIFDQFEIVRRKSEKKIRFFTLIFQVFPEFFKKKK